jgi:hypothetical protein
MRAARLLATAESPDAAQMDQSGSLGSSEVAGIALQYWIFDEIYASVRDFRKFKSG